MMDGECIVSNNQSLIGASGANLSDFSYDLGVAGTPPSLFQAVGSIFHDIGRGREIQAWAQVTTAIDGAAHTITCACDLVMADSADLATGLVVLASSGAIAQATLVAGYQFAFGSIPAGVSKRFLGFRFTTAVENCTAGAVMAGFLPHRQTVRVLGASS